MDREDRTRLYPHTAPSNKREQARSTTAGSKILAGPPGLSTLRSDIPVVAPSLPLFGGLDSPFVTSLSFSKVLRGNQAAVAKRLG